MNKIGLVVICALLFFLNTSAHSSDKETWQKLGNGWEAKVLSVEKRSKIRSTLVQNEHSKTFPLTGLILAPPVISTSGLYQGGVSLHKPLDAPPSDFKLVFDVSSISSRFKLRIIEGAPLIELPK
jgi:hypothetical protein